MLIFFSVPSFLPVASQVIVRDQSLSLLQWFNNYNFQKYNDAIDGLVPNGSLMFNENLEHNQCCPAISTFHSWLVLVSVSFFRSMGRPIDRSESSNVRVRIGKNRRLWALGPAVFRFIWHESIRVLFFSSFFFQKPWHSSIAAAPMGTLIGPSRLTTVPTDRSSWASARPPSSTVCPSRAASSREPNNAKTTARSIATIRPAKPPESTSASKWVVPSRPLRWCTSLSLDGNFGIFFIFLKLSNRILMNGFEHWFLRYVPFCPIAYFFYFLPRKTSRKAKQSLREVFCCRRKQCVPLH